MSDHTHHGPGSPPPDACPHEPDGHGEPTGEWRAGGRVPLNVYDPTGRPMFMARTPEDAARMARLLNLGEQVPAMAAEVASYRDGWRQVFGSNEDANTIMAEHRATAAVPQQPDREQLDRYDVQTAIHDAYVSVVKPPSFLSVASMWQLTDAVMALLASSRPARPSESERPDETDDWVNGTLDAMAPQVQEAVCRWASSRPPAQADPLDDVEHLGAGQVQSLDTDPSLTFPVACIELDDWSTEMVGAEVLLVPRAARSSAPAQADPSAPQDVPTAFSYTNWRGETSVRHVIPKGIRYAATEWHPEPQWLLDAFDIDRAADRSFAFSGIRASSLSVPQQGEVLWEGPAWKLISDEVVQAVDDERRVQVVTVPEPIVLDVTAETGDEASPVICQAYGQMSPMHVCLREAEGEWRSPAEGRSLALCSEHGAYALDEGWVQLPAVQSQPDHEGQND